MTKKKSVYLVALVLLAVAICFFIYYRNSVAIPAPQPTGGVRGDFGIDKNINESTIDNYLHRDGVVYRDVRMIDDPVNFEAIGGDHRLSGFIEGFEVVPYPYLATLDPLPPEVGATQYSGPTLFTKNEDGSYTANYEESMQILEDLFPKDKTLFIMCGGGGYTYMTKNLLVALGWDENKIYNVGGYWYYEGKKDIKVLNENGSLDTWKIPYHDIDFDKLTEKK